MFSCLVAHTAYVEVVWSAGPILQSFVCFLDRRCRYKTVALQFHQDAGLVPIPYTGEKLLSTNDRNNGTSNNKVESSTP